MLVIFPKNSIKRNLNHKILKVLKRLKTAKTDST